MTTKRTGAKIGILWGFVSWIYSDIYIFRISGSSGPGFNFTNSIVEKIFALPAYIHYKIFLPTAGWILLLFLPFSVVSFISTVLLGILIGLIVGCAFEKHKQGRASL